MPTLRFTMIVLLPLLLLAACGSDEDAKVDSPAVTAAPANPVPLRLAPEGLLGFPDKSADSASRTERPPAAAATIAPIPAPAPPAAPTEIGPPTEEEVRGLYAGIVFTYAFDACGLPLLGQAARQDIARRIEICPNSEVRKEAFRTVLKRATSAAERDPEKTRASALQACPDKREFLRRVMSHAGELQFDSSQPTDCGLLSPSLPGPPPGNPNQAMPSQGRIPE